MNNKFCMQIELTDDEIKFIAYLLNQVTIKPTIPNAVETVELVRNLMDKLPVMPVTDIPAPV